MRVMESNLESVWREIVAHVKASPVETEAERELRMSGQTEAWGKSAYFTNTSLWRSRERDLKAKLEEVYASSPDVPDRERRLVETAMKTACCCNNDSAAYTWCLVNWGVV